VTVATTYLHGRADFETFHVRLLSGRFKNSTITALKSTTRFLRPDIAVVHWSWKIEGDNNPDGTARPPRYGMMTLVAEKKNGKWLVIVGQNTNAILGIPPELQDIKTPIAIPGTALNPSGGTCLDEAGCSVFSRWQSVASFSNRLRCSFAIPRRFQLTPRKWLHLDFPICERSLQMVRKAFRDGLYVTPAF
jgi:uncharacterized protein (TIGR02246 family)